METVTKTFEEMIGQAQALHDGLKQAAEVEMNKLGFYGGNFVWCKGEYPKDYKLGIVVGGGFRTREPDPCCRTSEIYDYIPCVRVKHGSVVRIYAFDEVVQFESEIPEAWSKSDPSDPFADTTEDAIEEVIAQFKPIFEGDADGADSITITVPEVAIANMPYFTRLLKDSLDS